MEESISEFPQQLQNDYPLKVPKQAIFLYLFYKKPTQLYNSQYLFGLHNDNRIWTYLQDLPVEKDAAIGFLKGLAVKVMRGLHLTRF